MKKVLVIGAGEFQLSGINKLREKGYYVIAVDGNPNPPGENISDEFYHIDVKDVSGILDLLEQKRITIEGCMCFAAEIALRTVAKINQKLNLNGLSLEDVHIATNKGKQRELLKRASLPTPNFLRFKAGEILDYELIGKALQFPVIIKPVDSSGSRGVQVIHNLAELKENIGKSFNYSCFDSEIIIEEMIQGIEFTVESFVTKDNIHTLSISEKKKPTNNFTVSSELFYNSPFAMKLWDSIENVVNRFIKECNFKNTILHTEVLYSYSNQDIYIVETTVRSGGFGIFDKILPRTTGLDIVGLTIDVNMGKEIFLETIERNPCILRFFNVNKGVLKNTIKFKDIIDQLIDIEYGFFVKPGESIGFFDSDGARPGYMISYGKDWEAVFNKANLLEYAVRFDVASF